MSYNINNIRIDALKQDGLTITDKRGLPFESHEERWLAFENDALLRWYADYLNNIECITDEEWRLAMNDFKIAIGIK